MHSSLTYRLEDANWKNYVDFKLYFKLYEKQCNIHVVILSGNF